MSDDPRKLKKLLKTTDPNDPSQRNEHGFNPLLAAAQYCHYAVCEMVLKKGADGGAHPNGLVPAARGQAAVCEVLIEATANVHALHPQQQDTALIMVAQNVHKEPAAEWNVKSVTVAQVLLGSGSDPAATNENGRDALYCAKGEKLPQTVALLERALAAKAAARAEVKLRRRMCGSCGKVHECTLRAGCTSCKKAGVKEYTRYCETDCQLAH